MHQRRQCEAFARGGGGRAGRGGRDDELEGGDARVREWVEASEQGLGSL